MGCTTGAQRRGCACSQVQTPRPAGALGFPAAPCVQWISAGLLKARAARLRKTASDTGGRQRADGRERSVGRLGPS